MSSSSSEEEFELNYVKIDSKNDIRLLEKEDYELEWESYFTAIRDFNEEKIGKNLQVFLKKLIPDTIDKAKDTKDILKINQDYCKQYFRKIKQDNKVLNPAVNEILATDFKDKFIFNKTNLQHVSNILVYAINEIKKYKISSTKDFLDTINNLNLKKYDFFKIYANHDYLKNRDKEKIDYTFSRASSQCKSTTAYSSASNPLKDLYEDSELEENNLLDLNKYHSEAKGIHYIDMNPKNIICSSLLTDDYNYNEEEELKKLLTKECFNYPKANKNTLTEQKELPIELILILEKFKNVKTLIFQIQDVNDSFIKRAILILMNIKWLFISDIEEVKFDLGNEELQQGLNEMFNERSGELYNQFHKNRDLIYYPGSYLARTINCWEPEGDIFIGKLDKEKASKKNVDYIYNMQPYEYTSTFDNYLCNIYNEFGKLTSLKYITPFTNIINNKFGELQYEQKSEDFDESFDALNLSFGEKSERESNLPSSVNLNARTSNIQFFLQTVHNSNVNNNAKNSTPLLLGQFVNKNRAYFQMVSIYSYFFSQNLKKIKKMSLYFQTPFIYELSLLFNMRLNLDLSNFLIFTNQIDTLKEANFSFNSLDNKSFEYIIAIINKNTQLTSLKMSFFTPDINYLENSLFNFLSSKKKSLTNLFHEQREFEIRNNQSKEKMNNYILNEKLLESFGLNLCNFFNTLKLNTINRLEEFIMRFDIPLSLIDNNNYIILLIKFIINMLIMLTFQGNKLHTLKILAPHLEFNGSNFPYIRQFFREILLKDETEEMNNESEIQKKKTLRQRALKEQRVKENELKEKDKELKQKKGRKELLENINKEKGDNDDNKNSDTPDHKRSMTPKKSQEEASKKRKYEELAIKKRSRLNQNTYLENLTLQFKINDLPEIFNICLMNNITGLKTINLGYLDEITFIGFINNYKKNYNLLMNLKSLKISLGPSVTSYTSLEKYILEYININSPVIDEKFLFSDLQILSESKMNELVDLVYVEAVTPKLIVQISGDNKNMLSKILSKFINENKAKCKNEMISMITLMNMPKYIKLYNNDILECLTSFYGMRKNRAIICKEMPYQ